MQSSSEHHPRKHAVAQALQRGSKNTTYVTMALVGDFSFKLRLKRLYASAYSLSSHDIKAVIRRQDSQSSLMVTREQD